MGKVLPGLKTLSSCVSSCCCSWIHRAVEKGSVTGHLCYVAAERLPTAYHTISLHLDLSGDSEQLRGPSDCNIKNTC